MTETEPGDNNEPAAELKEGLTEVPSGLVVPSTFEPPGTSTEIGRPGPPLNKRTPFWIGFTGALGVAVAYVLARAVVDTSSVLLIIGLALFLAVGLEPAVSFFINRGLNRWLATVCIIAALLGLVAAFLAAAVPPTASEVHHLIKTWPHDQKEILAGKGTLGHLAKKLHISSYFSQKSINRLKSNLAGGVFGAGKIVISALAGLVSVIALTIYFLIALPSVKRLWLGMIPRSRRERTAQLTDAVFSRVGGFVLGNLLTSLIAGIGTFIWLLILGIPYPFLLALFVAIFDLIPVIGSTIAGIVVALVALSHSLLAAILTAIFYIVYRFLEDYLLTPRVMRHTVRISPGLTIVATLIGGALLGLVGALVAIPVAATIYLVLNEVVFPRLNQS